MTKAELRAARNKICNEAQKACRELEVQFALEHNPVKVGDVVAHTTFPKKIIRVQKITVPDYGKFGTPECLYHGNIIDSNSGKEYDDLTDELHQSYINEINGISYKYEVK